MQTFLPTPDFVESMKILDWRRLGKQRVEAMQLLRSLRGESTGWVNHPAFKMWQGYDNALVLYMNTAIQEWTARGYKNTMWMGQYTGDIQMPWWLGDSALHASHRSNLLRKDIEHYSQFNWLEGVDLPYVWPVS